MENPNGRGVYDYGNPRAWGDNAFWKFRRQGGLKYGSCPWYGMDICPIEMYFCKGYDYGEKVDLSKGYWNPKRKMWVAMHFSEVIKQP